MNFISLARTERALRLCWTLLVGVSLWLVAPRAPAQTVSNGFNVATYASGLTEATAMQFAPDGRLFVCQQNGELRVIKNGALLSTPFAALPVHNFFERGLLGVAFDPDFANNNYVYVYYTRNAEPRRNLVARLTANGDVAVPNSEITIFDLDDIQGGGNHNGGAIHFGKDGKLYVATGDDANRLLAQQTNNLRGKILRINKDGSIPEDNPFYATLGGRTRAIWAFGLRNPFTFAIHPVSGILHINDVGQSSWEEINLGRPGANYGWANTEGPTSNTAYDSPLFAYQHGNTNSTGRSIAGGAFYAPKNISFPTDYQGGYFYADYVNNWVRYLRTDNTSVLFGENYGNPVDLKLGADGALYVLSRARGRVYRVQFPIQVGGQIAFLGSPNPSQTVTFTFRPTDASGDIVRSAAVGSSPFVLDDIPRRAYQLHIESPGYLASNVNVDTTNGSVLNLAVSLRPGNIVADNSVDLLDLVALFDSYGASQGEGDYNPLADMNDDATIDLLDLVILFDYYGEEGDL